MKGFFDVPRVAGNDAGDETKKSNKKLRLLGENWLRKMKCQM